MSGWARDWTECRRCRLKIRPHKARGLCSTCYERLYRPGLLEGTNRAGEVAYWREEYERYREEEARAERAWLEWEEEVTAAWILWHESDSPDPAGWGMGREATT